MLSAWSCFHEQRDVSSAWLHDTEGLSVDNLVHLNYCWGAFAKVTNGKELKQYHMVAELERGHMYVMLTPTQRFESKSVKWMLSMGWSINSIITVNVIIIKVHMRILILCSLELYTMVMVTCHFSYTFCCLVNATFATF